MLNSKQDSSISGITRTGLEHFLLDIQASGSNSREVLFDVDAHRTEWFSTEVSSIHHGWFEVAFSNQKAFNSFSQTTLLPLISSFVGV